MSPVVYILIVSLAVIPCAWTLMRSVLQRRVARAETLLSRFTPFSPLPSLAVPPMAEMATLAENLEQSFRDAFIPNNEAQRFQAHYEPLFKQISQCLRGCDRFKVEISPSAAQFVHEFSTLHELIQRHNALYYEKTLLQHADFFEHCLQYPLDAQQRRAIVSEEVNCLVVSSAGSGKTSSIVGKVKYLTEIKHVEPQKILLISYTNKAAAELSARISTPGLRGYTFHKLALDLIGKATGKKPSIYENTDVLIAEAYKKMLEQEDFKHDVVDFFARFQSPLTEVEQRRNERKDFLSAQKKNSLKALFPDMDGNPIFVRSEQEQQICFALTVLGVDFRYEEAYEYAVGDEEHSQYHPDFSLYFKENGVERRIYLEHYAIDADGNVPKYFAKENNISYTEANQRYKNGIAWKEALHERMGTTLVHTSSADFQRTDIKTHLKGLLERAGVPIHERSDDELYALLLPEGSKQEKMVLRLVATFVMLVKSSGKSFEEILKEVKRNRDERSKFLIERVFLPIYEGYQEALRGRGQIDFSDAILWATEICRAKQPVAYEYIIVDEFQDISLDRYYFLSALRAGSPPAKLYCVGDDWQSIYRFSGSDMALFSHFPKYFGYTEINKIETTYRFGEPLVAISSHFIQRNEAQVKKNIRPFNAQASTQLMLCPYNRKNYAATLEPILASIPADKSVLLLGRYSFDDYYLSFLYPSVKEREKVYYIIGERKIEFLTVHKSKGLDAEYVILLQCNNDVYGFPSQISDDPVLNYVLMDSDKFPYGEERRLFYVAITRAKTKTFVLYDQGIPSIFVKELLHPQERSPQDYKKHPNANKRWTRAADGFLLQLYKEGKSVKYISQKMGRSQTAILMRLEALGCSVEKR